MIDDQSRVEMQMCRIEVETWQRKQFPNATLEGAGAHLLQEIEEACEELADCFFMAVQCENLGGAPMGLPLAIWEMMEGLGCIPERIIMAKLAKNKSRKWPETPNDQGVYNHEEG